MRGVYRANVAITGITTGKTLVYITAPSNKVVEILEAHVTPAGSNVTNQNAEVCWQLVGTLGTPTGTTLTPTKAEQGDQAAGSTVVGNVTASEPTYTSNTQFDRQGFGSLGGYRHQPLPEDRLTIAGAATWGLRLLTTITSADLTVEVTFREIG